MSTDQEINGEEEIDDVTLNTESCSNCMGNMDLKNGSISAEISDDIEGNDTCNDWSGKFCEYDIDDQLDGTVCHLSEIDEEFIDIFQVSTLMVEVMMMWTPS